MTRLFATVGTIISLLVVSEELSGPDTSLYIDVRSYHVRTINAHVVPAIPGMTASIASGQNSTTVSAASCPRQTGTMCFVNGDGVIIVGAGPAHSLSTPGTPTVTPSVARVGTGTGDVVTGPSGRTSYQYQIVARDKNGGLTAASTVGRTSTGQVALGSQSVSIASAKCSGTTVTATTASPHTLTTGAQIMISVSSGGNSCIGGIGTYQVSGAADNTHFTYSQGISTANGGSTSFSGTATVYWMNCNHVAWQAVTGAWQYYVYGRTLSGMTLLGVTHPSTSIANDTTFDDFGSTMMASSTLGIPSYVPTTPPTSASNDPLITTITSGAGTTRLTLAEPASNSVTNRTILFTDGPNILTAAAAASNLYWPIGENFVVNSFTDVAAVNVNNAWMYSGGLVLNETMTFRGSWVGQVPNTVPGNSSASFNFMGEPVVTTNANPGVYMSSSSGYYDRLAFTGGQNPMLIDTSGATPGGPQFGQHMYFGTSSSSTDYMGIALYLRGVAGLGSINAMRAGRINIQTGPGQQGGGFTGSTFTPSVYFSDIGTVFIDAIFMQDRGMLVRPDPAGGSFKVNWGYTQGGITPFITIAGQPTSVNSTANIEIQHTTDDTTFQPVLSYLPSEGQSTATTLLGNIDGAPGGGTPIITGPTANWIITGTTSGQNTNAISGANFTDNTVNVFGIGAIGYSMSLPAAPTLSVSGASGPAAETYYYSLLAYDAFGNSTPPGAVSRGLTVNGSQGILVTFPTSPAGLTAWTVCRSTRAGNPGACASVGAGFRVTGTSFLDTGNFFPNNSAAPTNRALSSGVGSAGIETQTLSVVGGGFKNAIYFNGTDNRKVALPDLSGSPVITVGYDSQARKTSAQAPRSLKNPATGLTFAVGPSDTLIRADVALACDLSSANATVFLTILYTDVSNTAQSQATGAANCTTLGAASVTAQEFLFIAKAGTSIQYSTKVVNTPSYDVRISLQQLGIN